ncbi:hypothetical protein SEMRO_4_G002920.1 [Seminavis robusta]|uniref:Uncharacterized protein n=1 Tax=Seminavis robusta TaxID=568900 RepID=A0A9N8H0L7_9STRA|nr:hypothetical protein SEMRO_4_G002920.1 [Seminavis robusta]|eukprot:Sro4_g002920.1 n/a (415) ;mRNA; f:8555-9933
MATAHSRARDQAISEYVAFLKSQGGEGWPDFNVSNFDKLLAPPKLTVILRIFHAAFDLVFPYLKADLFNRVPGRTIAMDATFKFLSKTKNDKGSSEETKCLHIVYGQYGYLMTWGFSGPENDECFQRLLWHLRKRCERLGQEHVDAVRASYSDTCCQGLQDPTTHWITKIFPNCKRAPHKDLFHAGKKLTDATQPLHELSPVFNQLVTSSLLKFDQSSVNHVVKYYLKNTKQNLALELAREQMMKLKVWRNKVKNYAPPRDKVETDLREAYATIETEDFKLKHAKSLEGEGYLPLLLSAKRGVRLGTENELKNLLLHVKKGCCEDPFPLEDINVAVDPHDNFTDFVRDRGTSQGESFHRLLNQLVNELTIQGAELGHKKLWLRGTRFNLAKDLLLQKLLKIEKMQGLADSQPTD